MLKRLTDRIRGAFRDDRYASALVRIAVLEVEKAALEARVQYAQTERPLVAVDTVSPEPTEPEQRKAYVATVANVHRNIYAAKLKAMVADFRAQLEKLDSTRDQNGTPITSYAPEDFDKILKGGINAAWLLYDWGELLVGEHFSSQEADKGTITS